jgi:hypothetical protein
MSSGSSLRGWQATAATDNRAWFAKDGVIHGQRASGQRSGEPAANAQSQLLYQRPLLDGDSISYEFYYEPGEVAVHPTLGRLAFLIEPSGVRLRWLTASEHHWTGLSIDNAIVEPLNRRGPNRLPLDDAQWNRMTISMTNEKVSLTLNDTVIYQRRMESSRETTFGLLHDRRRTAARVQKVVLSGDWPERLPPELCADVTAPIQNVGDETKAVLNELFEEESLATNLLAVRERAAPLAEQERYEFLSTWVLPSRGRTSFRLAGEIENNDNTEASQLVSPAYDLIDAAVRLDRLDELRETIERSEDGRERLALLCLIELASQHYDAATAAYEQLLARRDPQSHFSYASLWPETLVAVRGHRDPKMRANVAELTAFLHDNVMEGRSSGSTAWDYQIISLFAQRPSTGRLIEPLPKQSDWIPASSETAQTRGESHPLAQWLRRGDRVDKLVPHSADLLYYRVPLTGNFDIEGNVTAHTAQAGLLFGGRFHECYYDLAFYEGTLRAKDQAAISPPLNGHDKVRMRIRVRDRVCTTFFNGREVRSRRLPEHHEPWLAIYTDGQRLGGVRDLRISGNPVVPETVQMTADEELLGWLPYYGGAVGAANSGAPWRYLNDPMGGVVGAHQAALASSYFERLLRYHRPMFEDGTIEYEFFYVPGEVNTHPALDRIAFLVEPSGIKIHRITDGPFAKLESDPTNQTVERAHRRGPAALPLRENQWNKMAVAIRSDIVQLTLNDELVYQHPLEATNDRTFGLFHFADQTELRVRGVRVKGAWPRSLPLAANQQLANRTLSSLDATREKLPARFSHDFVGGRLPSKYFDLATYSIGDVAVADEGILASVKARGNWTNVSFTTRFAVHGDFDIDVSFDQAQLKGDKTAAVLLYTEHADPQRPYYRTMRFHSEDQTESLHGSVSLLRPDGSRTFDSSHVEPCESTSGRLRLARRGETIYYLFSAGDSTMYRLIGSQKGSVAETIPDGILFRAICDGTSTAKVTWEQIEIRAEKLMYFPPQDRLSGASKLPAVEWPIADKE